MVHFTLRQLQIFEAVARLKSFSKASRELHLTQPAISMQMRQLESLIGIPLIERLGKQIFITQAGNTLFHHAQVISRQLHQVQNDLNSLREDVMGCLDIAIISTAKYFIPSLLTRFCERYPQVKLKLSVSNREGILEQLKQNKVDLVIMGQPPTGNSALSIPFALNRLIIVASPQHPLASKKQLSLAEVVSYPFLLRESGSGTRQYLERMVREQELTLDMRMEIASNETIKQAVLGGMGLAFLSENTVKLELQTGHLVSLSVEGLPIDRQWHLVHHRDKNLSTVAQTFKGFLLGQALHLGLNPSST